MSRGRESTYRAAVRSDASSRFDLGPDRLFNRNFVLIWQGQLVSQLGSQAFIVAMMTWTMEVTGSARVMASVLVASALPAVILGPLAGVVADRYSRRLIIVGGDLLRGGALLVVAWVAVAYPAAPGRIVAALVIASLLNGAVGAVFNPALGASIPELVPYDRLAAANSLTQLSGQGAVVLGQVAGGLLYRALGAPLLFVIDGVSFLLSGISASWIRIPPQKGIGDSPGGEGRSLLANARAGLQFVWRQRGVRVFVLTTTMLNFVFMPVFVLLPFYARDLLVAGPEWYGFLLAALSAGSAAGIVAAGLLRLQGQHRASLLGGSLLCLPLTILALGWTQARVGALVLLTSAGICSGFINVFVITLIQVASPTEMRARVLAVVLALAHAAMPAGMALGGLAADLSGTGLPVVFSVCGILGLSVSGIALLSGSLRQLLAQPIG